MRKSISALLACLFLMFSSSGPAIAANRVNTIDIEAVLFEDGSMYVT